MYIKFNFGFTVSQDRNEEQMEEHLILFYSSDKIKYLCSFRKKNQASILLLSSEQNLSHGTNQRNVNSGHLTISCLQQSMQQKTEQQS